MEKTRFEPFAAGELRVLRMACYEAGAAFGDPGHTAEDRATLDDLAVEIIGELKKRLPQRRPRRRKSRSPCRSRRPWLTSRKSR